MEWLGTHYVNNSCPHMFEEVEIGIRDRNYILALQIPALGGK